MKYFRIVQEEEREFSQQDQLWLMIVCINGQFGIEINSRTEAVGRKMSNSRREAEAMFNHIGKKLESIADIDTAWDLLDVGFRQKTVKEMMFVINTRFNEYDFNSICKLKANYGYRTLPQIEDLIWEGKNWDRTIQVFFPPNSVPLAKFVPVSDAEDANFKVELITCYPLLPENNS